MLFRQQKEGRNGTGGTERDGRTKREEGKEERKKEVPSFLEEGEGRGGEGRGGLSHQGDSLMGVF